LEAKVGKSKNLRDQFPKTQKFFHRIKNVWDIIKTLTTNPKFLPKRLFKKDINSKERKMRNCPPENVSQNHYTMKVSVKKGRNIRKSN